jgi:hypothetical protein
MSKEDILLCLLIFVIMFVFSAIMWLIADR